jgi:hypothetical protein
MRKVTEEGGRLMLSELFANVISDQPTV